MKFFDTHSHLDMEPLSREVPAVIERAYRAGVSGVVNIGSSMRGSRASVQLSESFPNIWACVGLHPHDAGTILDLDSKMEELNTLATSDKVVAIGEVGLDFFSHETGSVVSKDVKKTQKELFESQIALAHDHKKPLVFHVRDAWDDFFSIIENWKLKIGNYPKGVVHCFTGGEKEAEKIIDLGFYVGFTGFLTFEQKKFDQIREAARLVPLDRILIETDAPFLAPEPHRGKTNEPAFVVEVAKKIADLKGVSLSEVANNTTKNAEDFFGIKIP